jgi:Ni,Fe-hydrogenase III large subunit
VTTTARAITGDQWRGAVAEALGGGWRFAGLHATGSDGAPSVRAAFTRAADQLLLTCGAADRSVDSIVDLAQAAAWDEREAHDLYGWTFAGHEPLRALVDHSAPTGAWTAPLEGRDPYQLAVGPIHAGIIESGHFRFSVVGERVLHLDLRLFYKHRGLEAAAEGRHHEEAIAHAQRACAADAVTNSVAYAHACESARGLWPDPELRRARTLLLELERLYNHLNDISAVCAGVGFAPGTMLFAALKEQAQRLNAALCGHRFLFGTVRVGASALAISAAEADAARAELDDLRDAFARGWRELAFAGSFQERLEGIGVATLEQVERLGGVGPVARAAGAAIDVRRAAPRLAYDDFAAAVPDRARGDVAARLEVRGLELAATFSLLERLLDGPLEPAASGAQPGREREAGVGIVESPRGQTLCAVELDGERVARLHLRTGSYANWPLLALACRDELLPDFPLINKSFELCYACVDR